MAMCARGSFSECRDNATSDDEAHHMRDAGEQGYPPR
jgi:hypothetical protein